MYYLHYFQANCNRKNPISDLVGYRATACIASDVVQLLAKVVTGCKLSQAVDDVKFWLLCVSLRCFASSLDAPLAFLLC